MHKDGRKQKGHWDKLSTEDVDRLRLCFLRARSYTGAAKEFGCHSRTVKRYAKSYQWIEDLAELDRQLQEEQDRQLVKERFDALKLCEETFTKLASALDKAEPGTKAAIATALANLGKHIELLKGKPTERTEELAPLVERLEKAYDNHKRRVAERERRRAELDKEAAEN